MKVGEQGEERLGTFKRGYEREINWNFRAVGGYSPVGRALHSREKADAVEADRRPRLRSFRQPFRYFLDFPATGARLSIAAAPVAASGR